MKPQLLITGLDIPTVEKMSELKTILCSYDSWFATEWFDESTGEIGYVTNTLVDNLETKLLKSQLEILASHLPWLQMGVSLMNHPRGEWSKPVVSFFVKNGKVTSDTMCHILHPKPPRNLTKKKESVS